MSDPYMVTAPFFSTAYRFAPHFCCGFRFKDLGFRFGGLGFCDLGFRVASKMKVP